MNGLINLIKDNFSAFIEVMFFIPSELQIWYWSEVAVLFFILLVALGVIFFSNRLIKKYSLGFPASALLAFLILSLTLGLTGLLVSIPRLDLIKVDPLLVVCIGSPVFNLVLGVITAFGSRLRKNHPITGMILLFGVGTLFAYLLFTTFIMFALRLFIT